jgi:hypothetical protein
MGSNFAATGDWMRNSRPALESVINAGVRTIVYDGDADFILNCTCFICDPKVATDESNS